VARYDVAVAALALDVKAQWLDTLLARHDIVGVTRVTQGVRRTISEEAMVQLAIIRDLHVGGGLPIPAAVAMSQVLSQRGEVTAGVVRWVADLPLLRQQVAAQVADAIERAVPRRRGRPPQRPSPDLREPY
jgi:hypothetical protein